MPIRDLTCGLPRFIPAFFDYTLMLAAILVDGRGRDTDQSQDVQRALHHFNRCWIRVGRDVVWTMESTPDCVSGCD